MNRKGKLSRSRPIRRQNPARRRAAFARSYGSEERVAFVRSLPCVVPDCRSPRGSQQNMHVRGDGLARKGDADTVIPCCPAHHSEAHNLGIRSWAAKYGINPTQLAVDTEALWQRRQKELAVEAAFRQEELAAEASFAKRRFWESFGGLVL